MRRRFNMVTPSFLKGMAALITAIAGIFAILYAGNEERKEPLDEAEYTQQITQSGDGTQINQSGNHATAIGETAIAINGGDGNSININQ
jgi:hypothetical protein